MATVQRSWTLRARAAKLTVHGAGLMATATRYSTVAAAVRAARPCCAPAPLHVAHLPRCVLVPACCCCSGGVRRLLHCGAPRRPRARRVQWWLLRTAYRVLCHCGYLRRAWRALPLWLPPPRMACFATVATSAAHGVLCHCGYLRRARRALPLWLPPPRTACFACALARERHPPCAQQWLAAARCRAHRLSGVGSAWAKCCALQRDALGALLLGAHLAG
jgi:hypothetical protein